MLYLDNVYKNGNKVDAVCVDINSRTIYFDGNKEDSVSLYRFSVYDSDKDGCLDMIDFVTLLNIFNVDSFYGVEDNILFVVNECIRNLIECFKNPLPFSSFLSLLKDSSVKWRLDDTLMIVTKGEDVYTMTLEYSFMEFEKYLERFEDNYDCVVDYRYWVV